MANIFFSPRHFISRFQTPATLVAGSPEARKTAADAIVGYVLSGMTVLGLMKLAGADVEDDPRSSDFGKGKIGPTRVDLWGGFQQPVRAIAQLIGDPIRSDVLLYGQRKELGSGNIVKLNRLEAIGRFFESKESPGAQDVLDLLRGEDFFGRPFPPRSKEEAGRMLYERYTPLNPQDIIDAVRWHGDLGGLFAIPSTLGASTQTFTTIRDVQDREAQKLYGQPFDVLALKDKQAINDLPSVRTKRQERQREADKAWLESMEVLDRNAKARWDGAWYRGQFSRIQEARFDATLEYRQSVLEYGAENNNERALNAYYEVFAQADAAANGVKDDAYYVNIERALAQLEAKWTPEQREYVRNREVRDVPGEFNKGYVALRQRLRDVGFWDMEATISLYKNNPQARAAYERYKRGGPQRLMGLSPTELQYAKTIEALVQAKQDQIRRENPDIDAGLITYYDRSILRDRPTIEGVRAYLAKTKARNAA